MHPVTSKDSSSGHVKFLQDNTYDTKKCALCVYFSN